MIERIIKKAPRRVPDWVRDLLAAVLFIVLLLTAHTIAGTI